MAGVCSNMWMYLSHVHTKQRARKMNLKGARRHSSISLLPTPCTTRENMAARALKVARQEEEGPVGPAVTCASLSKREPTPPKRADLQRLTDDLGNFDG